MCNLTMSVNKHKGCSASVKKRTLTGSIKHLRTAYLVSLTLFVTNSEFKFPFHIVVSDEACGGSTESTKILNRFGINFAHQLIHSSV